MASEEHGLTPTGRIKRMQLETVCESIVAAWGMVFPRIVEHSFKKTGPSNALDGGHDLSTSDSD